MDEHEVTNAEFRTFVEATGYVTTAERPTEWEDLKKQLPPGTPKPTEAMLVPGALVFTPPAQPVSLQDVARLVGLDARRELASPPRSWQYSRRPLGLSGRACVVGRRSRVRAMGRQTAAHGG